MVISKMRIDSGATQLNTQLNSLSSGKTGGEAGILPVQNDVVEISSGESKEKEWTLLFYNAGYSDESKMCTAKLVDMEKVGSDENTNVVVMNYRSPWFTERITGSNKEFRGAKTYYVTKNPDTGKGGSKLLSRLPVEVGSMARFVKSGPGQITSPVIMEHPKDINMGKKETLREFLLENIKKYPARHYAVVLSGHGAAFGGSMIVHKPEGRITNRELAEVFKEVAEKTGQKVDLVNMNTCYSGNIESVYPLKESVKNVVVSEAEVFAANQPFEKVLEDLQQGIKNGLNISGKDLAKLMVEETHRQPLGNLYTRSLSAVDMEKFGDLVDSIKKFQDAIITENVDGKTISEAIKNSEKIDYSSKPKQINLTDVGSFAEEIRKNSNSLKVKKAADDLQTSLKKCVFANQHADTIMNSLTGRVFSMLFSRGKSQGLTGLTMYLDNEIDHPESRLNQIQKTEYAKDVPTENFLRHISEKTKEKPGLVKRFFTGIKEKHTKLIEKLSKKTGIHSFFFNFAESIGTKVALFAAMATPGVVGVVTHKAFMGLLMGFSGKEVFRNTKNIATLASKEEKLKPEEKESLVDNIGKVGAMGALGVFTIHTLFGLFPSAIVWPLAIGALTARLGKEVAKAMVNNKEHKAFVEDTKKFEKMTTAEKLEFIDKK